MWEDVIIAQVLRLLVLDGELAVLHALVGELNVPVQIIDDQSDEVLVLNEVFRELLPRCSAGRLVGALGPLLEQLHAELQIL